MEITQQTLNNNMSKLDSVVLRLRRSPTYHTNLSSCRLADRILLQTHYGSITKSQRIEGNV